MLYIISLKAFIHCYLTILNKGDENNNNMTKANKTARAIGLPMCPAIKGRHKQNRRTAQ